MSIRSLADFMEVVPSVGAAVGLHRHRDRPGGPSGGCFSEGCGLLVAKNGDFSWPQCGLLMAISADFLVATDKGSLSTSGVDRSAISRGI